MYYKSVRKWAQTVAQDSRHGLATEIPTEKYIYIKEKPRLLEASKGFQRGTVLKTALVISRNMRFPASFRDMFEVYDIIAILRIWDHTVGSC